MLNRRLIILFSFLVLNLNALASENSLHVGTVGLFPLSIVTSQKLNWTHFSRNQALSPSLNWTVIKESWSDVDEEHYSQFVEALGASDCQTVDECIKSRANPYRDTEISEAIHWKSDCAEFGYFLRGYFAWKNHLPFGYVDAIATSEHEDPRYNENGNRPRHRTTVIRSSPSSPYFSGPTAISRMLDAVNSSDFRMGPTVDAHNSLFPDFYSPALKSHSLRPGTMIYDPDGHVMVISSIEANGKIHFIDAHPGSGVTHFELSIFNFPARMVPAQGGWFKNWRSVHLVGATKLLSGEFVGGKLRAETNAQIKDYSDEQYRGVPAVAMLADWDLARFFISQDIPNASLLQFVKFRLTNQNVPANPVAEFKESLEQICAVLQARVASVEEAIQNKIVLKPHPLTLPQNIYGAGGDWETYSTSARDAKIRNAFVILKDQTKSLLTANPNIADQLLHTYLEQAPSCKMTYLNSVRVPVELSLKEVVHRLTRISFDPYLCPELRWGAKVSFDPVLQVSDEALNCADLKNQDKMNWYRAEEGLRNSADRDPNADMGWNLADLTKLMSKAFFPPMLQVDPGLLLEQELHGKK